MYIGFTAINFNVPILYWWKLQSSLKSNVTAQVGYFINFCTKNLKLERIFLTPIPLGNVMFPDGS